MPEKKLWFDKSADNFPGKIFAREELEAKAKEDLNEDPKRTEADLKHIRDWITKQPHLAGNVRDGEHSSTSVSSWGEVYIITYMEEGLKIILKARIP